MMSAVRHPADSPDGPPHYLAADRLAIQSVAREFALKTVLPIANELDPVKGHIPMSLREEMGRLGFFGILIPEEYGGLGLGVFEYCLVTEELARAWMSVASIIARGNGLGSGFTEEQREKYLPLMARGDMLGAFALSEASAGSDVAALSCRADRTERGWVVNGSKMWCTFADEADYMILFARTRPFRAGENRREGISAFFIAKDRGRFPDGITGSPVRKIGYFGWDTWELGFNDFELPADALLGEEGRGFYSAMGNLEVARVHTAARAVGLARAALEDSIAYARQREQFGKPIASFQAIRFKIAEMAAQIEAARQLVYFVATEIDRGRRCSTEAAMAKLIASEMAEHVTSEGLQIHGGAGYTSDVAIQRHWRDARLTKIFEGTSEIQMRIISDALIGRS